MDDTTRANGYKHGRPEGRDVKPADEIVRKVIEALPAETRLYPDVYAWQVTDALEAATSAPAIDREALGDIIRPHIADEYMQGQVSPSDEVVLDEIFASGILRDVRDVQAEALERVREEIRALACWADPVTGRSGFNLGNDEDGEAGARMAVLDILAQAIREARNER